MSKRLKQSPPGILPKLGEQKQLIIYGPQMDEQENSLLEDLEGFNILMNPETVKAEIKVSIKEIKKLIEEIEKKMKQCEKLVVDMQKIDDNYNYLYCELRDLGII